MHADDAGEETFSLSPEDEEELAKRVAEARAGKRRSIPAAKVLARLRRRALSSR
jgi:hypothetical protein